MKKTLTINLGGAVYNIEEDAYSLLKEYLDSIKDAFSSYEDNLDIMGDIEARVAERFSENLSASKQVVTAADVEQLIAAMGSVEDIAGTEKAERPKSEPETETWKKKRLYRNPDDAILCGVASGIAAYFDIDPLIVRLLFFFSLFFGGAGILIYLLLCFIVPEAKTAAQKMEMQGQKINLSNLKEAAEEKIQAAKENMSKSRPLRKLTVALGTLVKVFFSFLAIIIGVAIVIASVAAFAALFFTFGNVLFNADSPYVDFPLKDFLSGASFYIATFAAFLTAFIPVVFLVNLGTSLVRRKLTFTLAWAMTTLMVWIIALTTLGVFAIKIAPQYEERLNSPENSEKITRNYDLRDFSSVKMNGNQKISITKGDLFAVQAVGRQSDLDNTRVAIEGGTLKISGDYKTRICVFCFVFRQTPEFSVTMPSLTSYRADGVVKSEIQGFSEPSFSIDVNGVTDTSASVSVGNLDVEGDGVSKLDLSGTAEKMTVRLDGPSTLTATALEAKNIRIDSDGPSTARVWATEKLDVTSDGPSSIYYKGSPDVSKDLRGPSKVRKIE